MPNSIAFAHQWTSAVSLARVFAFFTSGADESRIQLVSVAQSCLSELVLARALIDDWNVDFLQDVLVLSILPVVLSPSGGPTALTREVCELVGQAGWADVRRSGEVDWLTQFKNRQIVVKSSGVVFGMDMNGDHIALDVREELDIVVHVPF